MRIKFLILVATCFEVTLNAQTLSDLQSTHDHCFEGDVQISIDGICGQIIGENYWRQNGEISSRYIFNVTPVKKACPKNYSRVAGGACRKREELEQPKVENLPPAPNLPAIPPEFQICFEGEKQISIAFVCGRIWKQWATMQAAKDVL